MPNTNLKAALIATTVVLSACTGGGEDQVSISSSKEITDPVTVSVPVAYIDRPLPALSFDLKSPVQFNRGAKLFVRNPGSFDGEEILVNTLLLASAVEELDTEAQNIAIDIKDLETSFDGETLLFAARLVPEPVDTNIGLTTWNLWQYEFQTQEVRYVIPSRLQRNEGMETGSAQDTAPHFLNDDRIVFSSTRQVSTQQRQLDEGRAQLYPALTDSGAEPASVLHIYDPDENSGEIKQLSFNTSHDLDPVVLASGEIVFSRWNNTQGNNQISLFQIGPDGRYLSPLYGFHNNSSDTEGPNHHFTQARELADGSLAAIDRPFEGPTLGGDLVIIDRVNFVEKNRGVWGNEQSVSGGHQTISMEAVNTNTQRSPGGQYTAFYPLYDDSGRILVSWSPCRIMVGETPTPCNIVAPKDDEVLAAPLYGIWLHDRNDETQLPMVLAQEGRFISEIVAGVNRPFPNIPLEYGSYQSDLAADNKGLLLIDSVYDFDGIDQSALGIDAYSKPGTIAYSTRPARFLRFIIPVPIPDDDIYEIPGFAYGVSRSQSMREILGYSTIEPDGSVAVSVPANTAFGISVLDKSGRRISAQHRHWLQLAPGEVLHCNGCHTRDSNYAHGRIDSKPVSANPGAVNLGTRIGFSNTNENLYGTGEGQTMAEVYLQHFPAKTLQLQLIDTDTWTDPNTSTPDANIDLSYPSDWSDADLLPAGIDNIPPSSSMVVANLNTEGDSRIVINYIDHIQTIWERQRQDVVGNSVSCIGCHSAAEGIVPPGQLDLGSGPSNLQPLEHLRSYHELLRSDIKEMLDVTVVDRTRSCTETVLDQNGNDIVLTTSQNVSVSPTMRAGSAANSTRFFGCFDGGQCGYNNEPEPALEINCEEREGSIIVPTNNTVDHTNMLSPAELRLIAEWLDIGAQFYNNPFDARLTED